MVTTLKVSNNHSDINTTMTIRLNKVKSLMNHFLALVCLLVFSLPSIAETSLSASVDRNKIYESDTLNLIITGDIEMDFSFGGLMNFGRNQIESPVMEGLEQDFEILDQNQSYNMQSINGETKAKVTWTYSLAPKHTGTLTIPSAKYKNIESNPLTVTVSKGKTPKDAANPPQVFIEAVVDKSQAYVQEQVIYTLRLYSADRLASGELSVPESNDAIIEALGDTKKYFRMAYNRRYEVRERQYLLFPQKSGQLTISAQSFNGLLIDTRNRRRLRVREISEPIKIDVKAPPAQFSGKTWLPATSFHLSEKWESDPDNLMVGDSITRTLEIQALGLLGSALPPMGVADLKGLKIYPDTPTVESLQHESGAQSVRQESIALVAVSPNEIHLPEIQIPWWDTVNDVERIATIPARTFTIKANPDTPPSPKPIQSPSPTSNVDLTDTEKSVAQVIPVPVSVPESNNHLWYTIITLLMLGWATTTWLLLRRPQQTKREAINFNPELDTSKLSKLLCDAIKNDDNDMPKYLIQWANKFSETRQAGIKIQSLQDLENLDETLFHQASAFEQAHYSDQHSTRNNNYDKDLLLKQVKSLSKEKASSSQSSALKAMYP